MPWACKIGERSYRIKELDIGTLEDFAAEHGTEWVNVVYSPLVNLRTSKALVELCAAKMGVDPPWNGDGLPPLEVLEACWELVDDDIPESVDSEGNRSGDETATASSVAGASPSPLSPPE